MGNIDANPMFVNDTGRNYALKPGSPAIDAGSSVRYLGGPLSDLAGNDRGQDDPDTADTGEVVIGAAIDIGAYEFTSDVTADCPADQNFDGILSPADFFRPDRQLQRRLQLIEIKLNPAQCRRAAHGRIARRALLGSHSV